MPSARTRRRLERERSRHRRRVTALGLTAALVGVAVFAAWMARDRPPPQRPLPADVRDGSEEIDDQGDLTFTRLTDEYRIVYRVDDYAGGERNITTDDIRVVRPLESRIDRRRGEPPGDEVTFSQIASLGRLSIPRSETTQASAVVGTPTLASGDFRFDVGIPAALDGGVIEAREWRRIDGRECRVFRTGGPVGAGESPPYDPEGPEYADICVDRTGFLLEELWVSDGRALRRKLAIRIEPGETVPPRLLEHTATPIPAAQGGGSVREVESDSYPPGRSWFARSLPDGFEQFGRYAVVPAQPELVDEEQRARRRASIVDVWLRGIDLLIIDQGGTIGGVDIFSPDPSAQPVQAGDFGEAEAIPDFRMNEIRISLDRGRWIRIQGTLDFDDLLDVAEGLEVIESETNELVYLDDEPPDTEIESVPQT